jgi:transglutaminase-like putative cysteine protease
MRRALRWCGLFLLAALPVRAETPVAKKVEETWEAAYLEGAKMGYQHSLVEQVERDGRKLFRTTKTMLLTLRRYNSVVEMRWVSGTEETAEGKVVGVSFIQPVAAGQFVQTGRVEGDRLIVSTPSDPDGKAVPWNADVIGLYRQDHLFQDRKIKSGDRFRFLDYQLPFLSAVTMDVAVKKDEHSDVLVARKGGDKARGERVKKSLLRVEVTPGKVTVGETSIQLPRLVMWLDSERRPVREESELPGLGRLTLYHTTKAVAVEEGVAPALLPDLGLNSMVRLDRPLARPHESREVVYRITVSGDDDPAGTFVRDGRQRIEAVEGNRFLLRVRPVREPQEVENLGKVKEEYLQSSYFLDSDDEGIRAVARRETADETDPWRKAQRLEKWVHENMKGSTAVGFARASQVCRDLTGDCRQHGMLLAALCRAAGIPARTPVGLVYSTDDDGKGLLVFHMWTEVWVHGQWLMLDATLGRGSVGAGHLKVTDHSWHDIQTLAPLAPVTRVLSKVRVEVVTEKPAAAP